MSGIITKLKQINNQAKINSRRLFKCMYQYLSNYAYYLMFLSKKLIIVIYHSASTNKSVKKQNVLNTKSMLYYSLFWYNTKLQFGYSIFNINTNMDCKSTCYKYLTQPFPFAIKSKPDGIIYPNHLHQYLFKSISTICN